AQPDRPLVFDVGLVERHHGPVPRHRRYDRRGRIPAPDQHDHVPERVRRADRRLPGNPVRTRPALGSGSSPQPSPLFFFLSISREHSLSSLSTSYLNDYTFQSNVSPVHRWLRDQQEDKTKKTN